MTTASTLWTDYISNVNVRITGSTAALLPSNLSVTTTFSYPLSSTSFLSTPNPLNATTTTRLVCQAQLNDKVNMVNIVVYSLIFVCSVLGNSLVFLTILNCAPMRTITNMYLLNLAVADLLRTVVCMPATLLGFVFRCFLFGKYGCHVLICLQPITTSATSLTLAMIALERYHAICNPFRSRHWQTKLHCGIMIGSVWVIAVIVCLPFAFVANYNDQYRPTCFEHFPNSWRLAYWIIWVLLLFFGPLLFMAVVYALVIRSLWLGMKQQAKQSQLEQQLLTGVTSPAKSSSPKSRLFRPSRKTPIVSIRRCTIASPDGRAVSQLSLPTPAHLTPGEKSASDRDILSNGSDSRLASPTKGTVGIGMGMKKRIPGKKNPLPAMRSTHAEKHLTAKRRVIKMLIAIVIEFFVLWTPLSVFLVFRNSYQLTEFGSLLRNHFGGSVQNFLWVNSIMLILAYMSSCTNPITYCFMNSRFREAFLYNFGCSRSGSFGNTPHSTYNASTVLANRFPGLAGTAGGSSDTLTPPVQRASSSYYPRPFRMPLNHQNATSGAGVGGRVLPNRCLDVLETPSSPSSPSIHSSLNGQVLREEPEDEEEEEEMDSISAV